MNPLSIKITDPMIPCDKDTKQHLVSVLNMIYNSPPLGKYVFMLPGDLFIFLPTKTTLNELKQAHWAVATLEDGSDRIAEIAPIIPFHVGQQFHCSYDYYVPLDIRDFVFFKDLVFGKKLVFLYQNGILYVAHTGSNFQGNQWLRLMPYEEAA